MYLPADSAAQVVARLRAAADHDTLWLLCIADCHAGLLPALLEGCRAAQLRVCGGLFPGLVDGGSVRDSGLIAIPLPAASRVAIATLAADGATWHSPPPALPCGEAASAIILTECVARNIAALLEDIYDRYGNAITYVGAGTGYRDLRRAPSIFTEQGTSSDAALLVITPRATCVSVRHGWTRLLGPFVASRTDRNIIKEINWEPAGTFYRRQVATCNPALAARPVYPDINSVYPLCLAKEGGEDIMRDPTAITDADEIVVLSDVTESSMMYLAHGDPDALIGAAAQAVEALGIPEDVERCFISDCYSRALMLGDDFARELKVVREGLARFTDATPEGVLAMGEIAANGSTSLEFFNKTFVVAVTRR